MKITTKSRIIQSILLLLFLLIQGVLYLSFNATLGLLEGSLLLLGSYALYASILGLFFAAVDHEKSYLGFFCMHILVVLFGLVFASNVSQWILLGVMALLYVGILQLSFSAISQDISERLVLNPKRSILPHLKGIGYWLVLWLAVISYMWTVTNVNNDFLLQEATLSAQIKPFESVLQNLIPSYSSDLTIGSIIQDQVQQQLQDKNIPIDSSVLVQDQIEKINEQYDVSVSSNTTIIGALTQFVNNRFLSQITPEVFALSIASLVGITAFSLIGLYMLITRLFLKIFFEIARRKSIVVIETALVNQEKISL